VVDPGTLVVVTARALLAGEAAKLGRVALLGSPKVTTSAATSTQTPAVHR